MTGLCLIPHGLNRHMSKQVSNLSERNYQKLYHQYPTLKLKECFLTEGRKIPKGQSNS